MGGRWRYGRVSNSDPTSDTGPVKIIKYPITCHEQERKHRSLLYERNADRRLMFKADNTTIDRKIMFVSKNFTFSVIIYLIQSENRNEPCNF